MARARSIKPGFFHDTRLTAQKPLARLLFAGLWCYADRDGRIEDDPRQLKHDILPDDRCDVNALLQDLATGSKPFIIRYESGVVRYIQIRTWSRHQNPHVKEPASTIPAPNGIGPAPDKNQTGTEIPGAKTASSLNPVTDTLNPEPGNRDSPESKQQIPHLPRYLLDSLFVEWKAVYEQSGGSFTEADWDTAWTRWKILDGEQRAACVQNTKDRFAAEFWTDPTKVMRPYNYLSIDQKEWTRKILKPTRTKAQSVDEETERILEERSREREARKGANT